MALDAVLFDYGDTLFAFRYEERTHEGAVRALLDALAVDADPQLFVDGFWRHFDAVRSELPANAEVVYQELMAAVLAEGGVDTDGPALYEALRAEHRAWAPARELHPQSIELLETLRADGLRIGLVSNAFDPGEFMREDLAVHGIAGLIDAAVFSSELGVRKPDPRIYRVVLDDLGVEPAPRAVRGRPGARGRPGPRGAGHGHLPGHVLPLRRGRSDPRRSDREGAARRGQHRPVPRLTSGGRDRGGS